MTNHVNKLIDAVGDTYGNEAIEITLKLLNEFFHEFAREIDFLFKDDPENNRHSDGYRYAAYWCESWAKELNDKR